MLNIISVATLSLLLACSALASGMTNTHSSEVECHWPYWESFAAQFISNDGRVIDHSSEDKITTSEGQSYALFFALIANDPERFQRLLSWTENNLSQGDITARLPGWRWGKETKNDGNAHWHLLDDNTASDANLWIAYSLLEAGRLWHKPNYAIKGSMVAQRILQDETRVIDGIGRTLIPGTKGFEPKKGIWKLNPSYMPLQLMRRIAQDKMIIGWNELVESTKKVIQGAATKGIAPDWTHYSSRDGFIQKGLGSYDAIRVYLWLGMLSVNDPLRQTLVAPFSTMVHLIKQNQFPPEKINAASLTYKGVGPIGFSAAMIPFLATLGDHATLARQLKRIAQAPSVIQQKRYYDSVLLLFSMGWYQQRYRFDKQGYLIPNWKQGCDS